MTPMLIELLEQDIKLLSVAERDINSILCSLYRSCYRHNNYSMV